MPAGYVNLPAAKVPANAMLDFSPLNQGIDSARQWSQQQHNAMLADKQDQRADSDQSMQKTNFGNQQTTFQQGQEDREKQAWGRRAQAIDQIQDPNQRAAAWNQILPRHPGYDKLDPIYKDPMQGPRLVMSEAGLLETTGKDTPSNVKEWNYYNKLPEDQKQQYLTMKRAEKFYDTGPQFTAPNPVNPSAPPRVLPKDLAGAERQKTEGEAQGKAVVDLPRVEANADRMLRQIEDVRKSDLGRVTGYMGQLPTIRPESVDVEEKAGQLTGGAFLQAFESLKGGGQITEIEGSKATAALARLSNFKQSEPGYRQALDDFEFEVKQLVTLARTKAGKSAAPQDGETDVTTRAPSAQIPPQAVRLLQGNPTREVMQQFEAKYGPGSAAQFLQAR